MNTYCQVKALALAHDACSDALPKNVHVTNDPLCKLLREQVCNYDGLLTKRLTPYVKRWFDGEIASYELMDIIINMTHEP